MWLFIIIFCLLVYYVKKTYFVPSSPFVASVPNVFRKCFIILKSDFRGLFNVLLDIGIFTSKNNGVSKIRLGPVLIYFVSNAEDALTVLNKCLEKMFVYEFIVPFVGKEVVAASAKVFKENKRIIDLAFKHNVLNSFTDVFDEQSTRLVHKLSLNAGKGQVNVLPHITRVLLESVCQTVMGLNINGEDIATDEYVDKVHEVLESLTTRFQKPWLIPDLTFNYSTLKKKQDEALKIVWKLSENMVAQRKRERLQRLKNNKDFNYAERKFKSIIDVVIENSIDKDGELYTDLQLRQFTDNFLLAGFDTTSFEIMYTLICLGSNSEVQEKVYHEIKEVIGNNERIAKEDLPKLKYLDAVVKEVLRLYPIAMVMARYADEDVLLQNNVKISKGSSVVVHVWSINRDPMYWGPDAEEFIPERWLNPETLPKHPAAFATFSPGKRNCVGKAYAFMVMKYMLARMVQNFRFSADRSKIDFKFDVMLKLNGEHYVEYCKR